MASWMTQGPLALVLGFAGLFPKQCWDPLPGAGSGGNGGQGGSGAGDGNMAGEAGAAGATDPTDRVSEPLLGCNTSTGSGRLTPGTFELLPPAPVDPPSDPAPTWITDWSGDGHLAVGHYTTPVFEDAFGVIRIQWTRDGGYSVVSKVRVELSGAQEAPTAVTSCDGSVIAERLGDGTLYVNHPEIPPLPFDRDFFHDYLRLSEDGSTVTYLTGIRDQTRPSSEWHSSKGEVKGLLLETIESLSADGLTTFGTSFCFIEGCTPPTYFRWRPLAGEVADVTLGVPAPAVAADGESVVHELDDHRIGIWRESGSELVDCGTPCAVVGWSSRARVLLVRFGDGTSSIWTRTHGFRRLESLLTLPAGVALFPDTLSLDGWTIAGVATTDGVAYPYFRATLNADAYR